MNDENRKEENDKVEYIEKEEKKQIIHKETRFV